MNEIPETTRRRIRELLPNIRNKRARIVIEHILAHGHITTEDLEHYGYKHPPRAARDVREAAAARDTEAERLTDAHFTIRQALLVGRK